MNKKTAITFAILLCFTGFSQEKTVVGKNIKSIEFRLESHVEEAPIADNLFRIHLTTILADGQKIVSDQTQNKDDYIVEIDGATTMRSDRMSNKGTIQSYWFCKSYIQGGDNNIIIKVKRVEDADWIVTKKFPVYPVGNHDNPAADHKGGELIFTDAEVAEYQREMNKLSLSQVLHYARNFYQFGDNEKAKRIVGIGFQGRDPKEHDAIKKALQESDQQLSYLEAQSWKTAPEVQPIASLDKLYNFKRSDTLDFSTGPSKNVAILKEGNTFIQVKTYTTDTPDENGFVTSYGFEVNVYDISGGDFKKTITKRIEKKFPERSGASFNQFRSCPKGYILVNPDMYILFDKQFNIIFEKSNNSKVKERMYMDVDQLGTTNKFVVFYGDHGTSTSDNNYFVSTEMIDVEKNITYNKFGGYVDQIITSNVCIETPAYSRIFSLSNNEFVVIYHENKMTRIRKYKVENGDRQEICLVEAPGVFWDIKRLEGSKFMYYGTNGTYSADEINAFTVDFSHNTASDIRSSSKSISSLSSNGGANDHYYMYPQKDGSTVLIGDTEYDSKYGKTPVIRLYNQDFSLQGQYRVGMPAAAEIADYGYKINEDGSIGAYDKNDVYSGIKKDPTFKKPIHQFSGRKWRTDYYNGNYKFETLQSQGITGMNFKNCEDVLTNAITFFEEHTAFEYIREGNILYMMSPFAIVKLDLNHVVEAVPYSGPKKVFTTSRDVFRRAWYEK